MRYKFIALLGAIALSALPALSSAATMLSIVNNTDSYGTGKGDFTPCSTIAGDQGVIKPHSSRTIDISGLDLFCGNSNCEAYVYLSPDCSGKKFAKVVLNARTGIVTIMNYDKSHYKVTYDSKGAQIDPA